MTKSKSIKNNNDLQNSTQKANYWAKGTPLKPVMY